MGLVARDPHTDRNNDCGGRPSQLRAQVAGLQRIRKRHKQQVVAQLQTRMGMCHPFSIDPCMNSINRRVSVEQGIVDD